MRVVEQFPWQNCEGCLQRTNANSDVDAVTADRLRSSMSMSMSMSMARMGHRTGTKLLRYDIVEKPGRSTHGGSDRGG